MKRLVSLLAVPLLLAGLLAPAGAAPSQGGFATDNIEYVGNIPFESATSTGVTIKGKYMYLTSWKNISIYDISDPTAPALQGTLPVGFWFENEDVEVTPDGDFLFFSESLPGQPCGTNTCTVLHVVSVEDKTNPTPVAELQNAGDHTFSCILRCKWGYGSDGTIVDLRDPTDPKLAAAAGEKGNWHELIELPGSGAHDIDEYKKGFIVVSPLDFTPMIVDVRNPLKPKVLAIGDGPEGWTGERGYLWHSGAWPRSGKDRWLLMEGEDVLNPPKSATCNDKQGPFSTFDTSKWKKTGRVHITDTFNVANGTYQDGSPAANAFGCTAHWFEHHPTFRNGGLVAVAWYDHGTRFLDVDSKGKISEAGWFLPYVGETSAAYWAPTDKKKRLLYAVDYTRGIDILRWNGKL